MNPPQASIPLNGQPTGYIDKILNHTKPGFPMHVWAWFVKAPEFLKVVKHKR